MNKNPALLLRTSLLGLAVLTAQVGSGERAQASTIYTGYIDVADINTSASLGYVDNTFNSYGEYGTTPNFANKLVVTFTDAATPFSITALNGPNANFPLFSGIQGFSSTNANLGRGSFNYSYLGGRWRRLHGLPS
jgi:hypothetical protein